MVRGSIDPCNVTFCIGYLRFEPAGFAWRLRQRLSGTHAGLHREGKVPLAPQSREPLTDSRTVVGDKLSRAVDLRGPTRYDALRPVAQGLDSPSRGVARTPAKGHSVWRPLVFQAKGRWPGDSGV